MAPGAQILTGGLAAPEDCECGGESTIRDMIVMMMLLTLLLSGVVMMLMMMMMIYEHHTVWRRYVKRKEWVWSCDSFAGCLLKQRISSQSKVIFTRPPEKLTS